MAKAAKKKTATKKATRRAPKPTVTKWLRPSNRFSHCVEIDYDVTRNCGPSCKDDYCRCGTIDNAKVEEVRIWSIVSEFLDGGKASKTKNPFDKDELAEYVTERVVRARRLDDTEGFYINIERGYYGEEIGDVTLDCGFNDMCLFMKSMEKMATMERIQAALVEEYGYYLDDLKGKHYDGIQKINLHDIKRQTEHYQKTERDVVADYKERHENAEGEYILGIVLEVAEGEYRLIDGYHRTASVEQLGHTKGKYLVFTYDKYQYNDDDGH